MKPASVGRASVPASKRRRDGRPTNNKLLSIFGYVREEMIVGMGGNIPGHSIKISVKPGIGGGPWALALIQVQRSGKPCGFR